MNIDKTLEERGDRYGTFSGNASMTQALKEVMHRGQWTRLSETQKEALEMVAHKISRILNGDPDYQDNWVDAIGYLTLALKEMQRGE